MKPRIEGHEPPPPARARTFALVAGAGGLILVSVLAFRAAGGLGVGVLGLLVLFISVRVELEGNRPIGSIMTSNLYASQHEAESRKTRAERAEIFSDRARVMSGARLAAIMGGVLVVIGLCILAILP